MQASGTGGGAANIPEQFLTELFGDAVSDQDRLVIFCMGSGASASSWNETASAAASVCAKAAGYANIYFGLCLQDGRFTSTTRRGEAKTTTKGVCLWADIDVLGPKKVSGKGYAPDMASAHRVLGNFNYAPTWLVETGGGLHAYWLLREPVDITDEKERASMEAAVYGVQRALQEFGGFEIDTTHSLASVLRVPGVVSLKYGTLVNWVKRDGPRYNLSDFDDCARAPTGSNGVRTLQSIIEGSPTGLVLDPAAVPDRGKLGLLMEIPNFRNAWNGRRFTSQSSRDFSMAIYAIKNGWSDQEVCNLLIHARTTAGADLKFRSGPKADIYYRLTIDKAKAGPQREEALEQLEESMAAIQSQESTVLDQAPKMASSVNLLMPQLRFVALHKYMDDGCAKYELVLEDGNYPIGHVDVLRSHYHFSGVVAAATNRTIPSMSKEEWFVVFQSMLACVKTVDMGTQSSVGAKMLGVLRDYFASRPPVDIAERVDALESSGSYLADRDGDQVVVYFPRAVSRYMKAHNDKLPEFDLYKRLQMLGSTEWKQRVVNDTTGKTRYFSPWSIKLETLEGD